MALILTRGLSPSVNEAVRALRWRKLGALVSKCNFLQGLAKQPETRHMLSFLSSDCCYSTNFSSCSSLLCRGGDLNHPGKENAPVPSMVGGGGGTYHCRFKPMKGKGRV